MATNPRDLREWSTFDKKSQERLRRGEIVTGGDGRRFQWVNGHATVVGSPTHREGMARREANRRGMAPNMSPGPVTSNPSPVGVPSQPRGPGRNGSDPTLSDGLEPGSGGVPDPRGAPRGGEPDARSDVLEGQIDEADKARQRDAKARILSVLAEYGLESLADFVWQQIMQGKSDAEVLQDIRNTPEFKKRFPAIETRNKRGLAPISPGEYVAYERQARQIMRAAGIPEGFYDGQDDFTGFLDRDVSISELNDRIQMGKQAAFEAPADVRAALQRDYGVSEGGLTAFFLDPDRAQPLLEKQYRAAQIGGAATRTGFGATTREQNERLATLGVTVGQAQEGFGVLGDSRELFDSLDRTEDTISTDEQIGAAFEGNSNARRRIEQRRRGRQARFETGGGFAAGQTGLSGLGRTP